MASNSANCYICNLGFAELDISIKRDGCNFLTHNKCSDLNNSEIKCLGFKNQILKFFCEACNNGSRDIPELKLLINRLLAEVTELKGQKNNNNVQNQSEEFIIGEVGERNIRASNLIFYNIPESNLDNAVDQVNHQEINRNALKPTACRPKSKDEMVVLSLRHNKACMLCGQKEISEKLYGLLYLIKNHVVHYFCILLSSMAVQSGADNEGIWGFLLKDIQAELTRGSQEICFYCNKKGATISCCDEKCQKVFHLPCGLKNGSMHQFFQSFQSFCQEHRILQTIEASELNKSTPTQCAICKDAVIPSPVPTSIWAPCCKRNAWFHRECVQDLALSAGYFFKCPLCNDVDNFKSTMLTLGIYIPSRNASWETEPNAFADLSERHFVCSIETCLCPHTETRKFRHEFGSWEILLCKSCGSNGTHRLCSSIKGEQEDWCCAVCKEVTDKDTIKKNKIPVELLDNGNCSKSPGMFEEQDLSGPQRLNSVIVANRSQLQLSDDPILISDSDDSNHSSVQCISDDEPSNTYAIENTNPHAVEQPNTHAIEQPNTHAIEQPNTHAIEQPNTHAIEQPITHAIEQPITHAIEQSNTHSQVQQIPRIQLPIISSYGSIRPGVIMNFSGNGYHLFAYPMSIDLTSDDDD